MATTITISKNTTEGNVFTTTIFLATEVSMIGKKNLIMYRKPYLSDARKENADSNIIYDSKDIVQTIVIRAILEGEDRNQNPNYSGTRTSIQVKEDLLRIFRYGDEFKVLIAGDTCKDYSETASGQFDSATGTAGQYRCNILDWRFDEIPSDSDYPTYNCTVNLIIGKRKS